MTVKFGFEFSAWLICTLTWHLHGPAARQHAMPGFTQCHVSNVASTNFTLNTLLPLTSHKTCTCANGCRMHLLLVSKACNSAVITLQGGMAALIMRLRQDGHEELQVYGPRGVYASMLRQSVFNTLCWSGKIPVQDGQQQRIAM